jgi:hypothetical protein
MLLVLTAKVVEEAAKMRDTRRWSITTGTGRFFIVFNATAGIHIVEIAVAIEFASKLSTGSHLPLHCMVIRPSRRGVPSGLQEFANNNVAPNRYRMNVSSFRCWESLHTSIVDQGFCFRRRVCERAHRDRPKLVMTVCPRMDLNGA